MLKIIEKNKKILIIIGVILTLPFTLPIITMLLEIIFNLGHYVGTLIQRVCLC